ncbi:hypothetical protein PLESTB_000968500 [Pleodorina starrii]|uniref:Uncharacterized protein n=1 Tax=Pleodorina starrii TaxID=330485 RepID=A0A9W6F3X1_9CHLO|nr:hypothetical protein PLESTB_000968500 [Pleodorina starrii]GLC70956.1 hypothetical protein PLESTF_001054800 [Pleodorina starrii]
MKTSHPHVVHHMTDEDKDRIAKEKYGRSFDDLDEHERRSVIGTFAAAAKRMEQQEEQEERHGQGQERKEEGDRQATTHPTSHTHVHHYMTDEDKERISKEKYGKKYDDLDEHERHSVIGTFANIVKRMEKQQEEQRQGQ